jgi:hypothetical protein
MVVCEDIIILLNRYTIFSFNKDELKGQDNPTLQIIYTGRCPLHIKYIKKYNLTKIKNG